MTNEDKILWILNYLCVGRDNKGNGKGEISDILKQYQIPFKCRDIKKLSEQMEKDGLVETTFKNKLLFFPKSNLFLTEKGRNYIEKERYNKSYFYSINGPGVSDFGGDGDGWLNRLKLSWMLKMWDSPPNLFIQIIAALIAFSILIIGYLNYVK